MEHLRFEDMQLSKEIYQAVLDMGFEEATPIQIGRASCRERVLPPV